MEHVEPNRRFLLVGIIVIVAILAGAAAAFYAPGIVADDTEDRVAVVELHGMIDAQNAQHVEAHLRDARMNDSIHAVVLEVNSDGGLPAESERIRTAVERTAADMPVKAAVDTSAASGAYLAMTAADTIYVAPSAQAIGSVGVTGPVAPPMTPQEDATGPNKGQIHPDDDLHRAETLASIFADTVIDDRGDRLALDRAELMQADIYLGVEAVDNGLADDLGHTDVAITNAAAEAGLSDYAVDRFGTGTQDPLDFLFGIEDQQSANVTDTDVPAGVHLAINPVALDAIGLSTDAGGETE